MARQVDRWTRQYRMSETEQIDEMEKLMEWLPRHLPPLSWTKSPLPAPSATAFDR